MHKICEICKKAPATVHLTDIHDNVKKELHMCEACAEEKGISPKAGASMQQILNVISSKSKGGDKPSIVPAAEDEFACDNCGMTWSEFRSGGRFGCTNDYDVFRDKITPLLDDIQARSHKHVGKVPGNQDNASQAWRGLMEFQRQLREAVELENYEEAAKLRDIISEMQAGE